MPPSRRSIPTQCFFVSCDLNPSTKLGKAAALVPRRHRFEMSIQEQAAALMTDGLSFSAERPQLNVFATFAAFMEGIAREGFEMWRYQRNLNGVKRRAQRRDALVSRRRLHRPRSFLRVEPRLGQPRPRYLPFLHRFYAPADARAAFIAVRDAAAHSAGTSSRFRATTCRCSPSRAAAIRCGRPMSRGRRHRDRKQPQAKTAILALGAPGYLAASASEKATAAGVPTDVYRRQRVSRSRGFLAGLATRYTRVLTVEDGLIGTPAVGPAGFRRTRRFALASAGVALHHFGIVDPRSRRPKRSSRSGSISASARSTCWTRCSRNPSAKDPTCHQRFAPSFPQPGLDEARSHCCASVVGLSLVGYAQSPIGVQEPSWSPDGKRIAVSYLDRLWSMTPDGKQARAYSRPQDLRTSKPR